MENTLRLLFDFQRFQPNPRLTALINEAERRCGQELDDDMLELVSAAGAPDLPRRRAVEQEDADAGK